MTGAWPALDEALVDPAVEGEIDWVIGLITEVRAVRAEMNVPPGAWLDLFLKDVDRDRMARLEGFGEAIRRVARLSRLEPLSGEVPKGSVQIVIGEATAVIPLAGVIDVAQEQDRLKREIDKVAGDIAKVEKKLGNQQFLAKAPEAVVAEQKERRDEALRARERLSAALERLSAL
jgi:valyl-tRNA synthetase